MVNGAPTAEVLVQEGRALEQGMPHAPDPWLLVTASLCLLVGGWSRAALGFWDWLCLGMALFNVGFFVYRVRRYRQWVARRDAWIALVRRARDARGDAG